MHRSSSAISRLEAALPRSRRSAEEALEGAIAFKTRAHIEMQDVSETLQVHEDSEKLLEDNKLIVRTLAEGLPSYVAKVRDVQTDFEGFEHNFPKLEQSVKVYHSRSEKTADDIDALRKQVGTLTQSQEAFSKLWVIAPPLLTLVVAVIWYGVQR